MVVLPVPGRDVGIASPLNAPEHHFTERLPLTCALLDLASQCLRGSCGGATMPTSPPRSPSSSTLRAGAAAVLEELARGRRSSGPPSASGESEGRAVASHRTGAVETVLLRRLRNGYHERRGNAPAAAHGGAPCADFFILLC